VIAIALLVLVLLFAAAVTVAIRARNMQYWLWGYLTRPKPPKAEGPVHVMFCFVEIGRASCRERV